MNAKTFTVSAEWDPECRVWYVADSDVPGLVAEAPDVEALALKLEELIPELLELNAHLLEEPHVERAPFELIARRSFGASTHC